MTEKGGMIAREIEVRRGLAGPIPVNAGIVPFLEDHAEAGIAPILESHVNAGPFHIRMGMLTMVRIPRRSGSPATLVWTP